MLIFFKGSNLKFGEICDYKYRFNRGKCYRLLTSENVESTIYCATGMRCKYLLLLWLVISLLTQDILLNHDPGTLVLNSE